MPDTGIFLVIQQKNPKGDGMTQTAQMAAFALSGDYERLSAGHVQKLKLHLLDSLASFVWSRHQELPKNVARALAFLNGNGNANATTLPLDHLAQLYTTYIRYPDFMDNFLAKEATCHPSDNIGLLLAASQGRSVSGKQFLMAMAVSYAIQCRLTQQLPVMINGHDHTALLAFSATAGGGRLMGLDEVMLGNALGIAGNNLNPFVTSRASYTTQWKGLASSLVNASCMNILSVALTGITGPDQLFEIPEKGYNAISGLTLDYDWKKEDFSLLDRCILKTYNAEVHTQVTLEIICKLASEHALDPDQVSEIDITIFLTAFHIVGGGEYGDRTAVYSKEQADHSLPYLAAVALLDKEVYPPQLTPDRINSDDVQALLKKVKVHTRFPLHRPTKLAGILDPYTEAYPEWTKCKVEMSLTNGTKLQCEAADFEGFFTRPLSAAAVQGKFEKLNHAYLNKMDIAAIFSMVNNLEDFYVDDLLQVVLRDGK